MITREPTLERLAIAQSLMLDRLDELLQGLRSHSRDFH